MAAVEVKGLRETIKNLERLGIDVKDLKAAFTKIGANVVREAQSLVPIRSGALKNSIRPSKTKNKAVIRAGGAKVPYAGVIEYGWQARGIEPHSYLIEARGRQEATTVRMVDEELNELIRKANFTIK